MTTDTIPADLDIEYLRISCNAHKIPAPTEIEECAFIELCGKNYSDGMCDVDARAAAWKVYKKYHEISAN